MSFDMLDFLAQAKRQADYNVFMKSKRWEKIRDRKLKQARRRCEKCGDTKRLEVHHLTYDRFGGNERMTDLQVLCHPCHEAAHGHTF